MARTIEYSPDAEGINGIIQRYFDIYLPANLEDQIEEKMRNPFYSVNGMMEMVDQNDIVNAREVTRLTESYFKDILDYKNYEYFIAYAVGTKKYIFQKNGSIVGNKIVAGQSGSRTYEQKYSFEDDNTFLSVNDIVDGKGPTYIQARDIDYERKSWFSATLVSRTTAMPDGHGSIYNSETVALSGDEVSKYYMELPILIMRNATPMHESDLKELEAYSRKVANGKLELEVSVSPYTVLYVEGVSGSERSIPNPTSASTSEDVLASEKGLFVKRKDFIIKAADGLVSEILSSMGDDDITPKDLLGAVSDIFFVGQDVRLIGSSNSYEAPGVIEKIFLDGNDVKVRVKSKNETDPFILRPIHGVDSEILAIASSSVRVGITNPGYSRGKRRRRNIYSDKSKVSRGAKGSAISAINIYSSTDNRSSALGSFPRQFLGPSLEEIARGVNQQKIDAENARRKEAGGDDGTGGTPSGYATPETGGTNGVTADINSLASIFTAEEIATVNQRFNYAAGPKLREDWDRFFAFTSESITPKESISSALADMYTFDMATVRFHKAYDIVSLKINILYNPFGPAFNGHIRPKFRKGNVSLNVFDLAGIKIGLKVSK